MSIFSRPRFAVSITTILLIVHVILLTTAVAPRISLILFTISPFLVIWMVYTVLRNDVYKGRELNKDEEWGYADRESSSLGMF